VDTAKRLDDVQTLLLEGKVNEANESLAAMKDELAAESAAAGVKQPPPPRATNTILLAFARALVEHLGSPPSLHALQVELATSLESAAGAGAAKE
jgi:hypothetical protein